MKLIMQLIIGGFVGFFVVYALMNFSEVRFSGEITVISLIIFSLILIAMSIFQYIKIKSLNLQNFSGDEEDEIQDKKYKMFADYSLYANVSFVLSILALSLSFITTQNVILTVTSIFLIVTTYFLIHYMMYLMKHVYPERKFPNTSDAQNVLDYADDGEKHVILDGLYKSHSLLNFSLITAITLSTIYSLTREDPQTFSIILMAMVLLVVNSKYLFVIRNK
ncbi:DUF3169 family protein [Metabacillus halosaccharovorans]|uniref:DUF3169 family protein n=1 Tax=Metabacillus halosaccharovorans TaxID=930124 RepID=UPI001C1F8378|nr:DUF3169 family protein [Metabacillus halosaccharovorans]MBU7595164.1 DUF3169 family protein [Metabacillus halosaccharovorans]